MDLIAALVAIVIRAYHYYVRVRARARANYTDTRNGAESLARKTYLRQSACLQTLCGIYRVIKKFPHCLKISIARARARM
jgi:hypothetical protein